jgi:hypothetical protein
VPIKLSNSILSILFIAILSTPIYSILEIVALMTGTLTSQSQSVTPGAIKGIKDLLLLLACGLALIYLFTRKRIKNRTIIHLYFLASLLLLSIIFSILSGSPLLLILAGIRWAIPFLFIFIMYDLVTEEFIIKVANLLKILFFCHLFVQFIQLFFAPPWFGVGVLGFSLRNPGMFLIPSTGAIFSICCFIFFMCFLNVNKLLFWFLCFLSVLLTVSGTGMICFIFLSLLLILFKFMSANASLLISSGTVLSLIPAFLWLSSFGRGGNYAEKSGGTRLELFIQSLYNSSTLSPHFGAGTNVATILSKNNQLDEVFITDSMYTSVLVNLGYIGLIFYLIFLIYLFYRAIAKNDKTMMLVNIFMVLMSLTIVWTEAFPVNIIISCLVAYLISPKRKPLSKERFLNENS